jgi:hypothetical protein
MRFIFPLLLVLIACGKKVEDQPFYEVTPSSLGADSDGDGMLDWDEKYVGRDPFLADVNEALPVVDDAVTLIDANSREIKLPAIFRRTLRDSLMQEVGSMTRVTHPRMNAWLTRVDQTPEYWRARFANFTFKKIRIESEVAQNLLRSFAGQHTFMDDELDKKLQNIEQKTYRLVVSTPLKEHIFHLSPKVDLREFIEARFKTRFDHEDRIVQVNEHEQGVAQSDGLDYHVATPIWRTVGMPLNLKVSPLPGETYALVLATVEEFRRAALNNANVIYPQKLSRQLRYGHETSVVAFFPQALQARWKDHHDTMPIRIGNGDRERTCEFTKRKLIDYQPRVLASAQQVLNYVTFIGAQDIRIDWTESGAEGMAAKFTMHVLAGEINASLSQESVSIGVIKSACLYLIPLKIQHHPLWNEAQGYFSWLQER